MIGSGLLGFTIFPIYPLLMELANEVSFPVGEASSIGYLFAGAQIWTFAFGFAISTVVTGETS